MYNYESGSNVIPFGQKLTKNKIKRKEGVNTNKDGSVRNIHGKVYVDFIYLGERVRESSGFSWNSENKKTVRDLLDKIIVKINENKFVFSKTFPKSKKLDLFNHLESTVLNRRKKPDQVLFKDYIWEWYNLKRDSESISGRTLNGYKGYIEKYLIPFFGDIEFGMFNKTLFDQFISWAKEQKYRKKAVGNESIKKYFVVLKMVCKDAAIKNGWIGSYDPFFGFKMPKSKIKPYEKISPFSIDEQITIIALLPNHWKPYFEFAFASGVRQGEKRAIKIENIDWENKILSIESAMTLDENGKIIEGPCKNDYSRRKIKLSPKMFSALKKQNKIYEQFKGKYFFCNEQGSLIDPSNLRSIVWIPTLEEAKLVYRDMKQTRHSFGTYQLSKRTDPLKIAHVMGHRDAEMVLKVYSKYIDDGTAIED